MAAEMITVYIDPVQLSVQKTNNYSLFLAKMVNGRFNVIWQSRGPIATVTNPADEYRNTFMIEVPSYEVNYGEITTTGGRRHLLCKRARAERLHRPDSEPRPNGTFDPPTNNGTAGEITINNQLAGNPHAILLDNAGQPIFVDIESGMDNGVATTLTPIETYRFWFDNFQDTGTLIPDSVGNGAIVTFSGGATTQVISFNQSGQWQTGPLAQTVDLAEMAGLGQEGNLLTVTVIATFRNPLTVAAVTYLLSRLFEKFSAGLRPRTLQAQLGSLRLLVGFSGPRRGLAAVGLDKFEAAVDLALTSARADNRPVCRTRPGC